MVMAVSDDGGIEGGGGGDLLFESVVRLKRKTDTADSMACGDNCSGNGVCLNGSCYCQVRTHYVDVIFTL